MKTILVIDDEQPIRELLRQALEELDYRVIEAAHGDDALTLVDEEPVDLVITDVIMPRKEGLQTIRELKAKFPALKVIAMSGGSIHIPTNLALDAAQTFGAELVLQKPVDIDEFVLSVGRVLNG